MKSNYGEVPIKLPQDRNSDFEPKVVPKHKRDISEIEGQIISMYAKGMSTRQISDQVQDIYGFEVSQSLVTGITNKLMPEIERMAEKAAQRRLSHRVHRCDCVQRAGQRRNQKTGCICHSWY